MVHLWVENFFEVFATVALAFILSKIGAVGERSAQRATHFSILLYLGAGIIGTFHHLYFTGSPLFITALGATFSALEIVPLTLLGFEVFETLRLRLRSAWRETAGDSGRCRGSPFPLELRRGRSRVLDPGAPRPE